MSGPLVPLIECSRVERHFGGVYAVRDASFVVGDGTVTALIGPNGAGKTTLLNLLSGLDRPTSGTIAIQGTPIDGLKAHEIATRFSITRTFQTPRVFPSLSVFANASVGRHVRTRGELVSALLRGRRASERSMRDDPVWEVLDEMGLAQKAHRPAGRLSYGEQRHLEIARALAFEPRCLLMDEPAAGLGPPEVEALSETLQRIRDRGVTVVLVEHKMPLVMRVSTHIVVLNFGEVLMSGTPAVVRRDRRVRDAYLGGSDGH